MTCRTEVRRGIALPLVLTVLVVMFLLGGTVAGLCISQARMAHLHWEQTQSRQQAMAGLVEAQAWLGPSIDWTTGQANYADHEYQVDSSVPAFYTIQVESATRDSAMIVSTGYFKNPDGSRRNAVSERTAFQRAAFGFRYPVQTIATIKLTASHIVAPTNDIAVRTNAGSIVVDNTTVIEGDVILNGVVAPSSTSGTISGNINMTELIAQLFAVTVPSNVPSASGPNITMP